MEVTLSRTPFRSNPAENASVRKTSLGNVKKRFEYRSDSDADADADADADDINELGITFWTLNVVHVRAIQFNPLGA